MLFILLFKVNCLYLFTKELVALQVLPSPTTGKFSFVPSGEYRDSTLTACNSDKGKENNFEDISASSFAFKPINESASFPYFNAANKVSDCWLLSTSLVFGSTIRI